MTGCAGGLSGGLWAKYDAALEPGAAFVLDALDFDARMRAARAVIVGEGRIDEQTLQGKIAGEIATRARQAGVPCFAIVGTSELDAFGARMLDLQRVLEATDLDAIAAAAASEPARMRTFCQREMLPGRRLRRRSGSPVSPA